MKRLKSFIFFVIIVFANCLSIIPVSANANDFYFDDITIDYYLSKNPDNTSTLEVVENLTAIFPDRHQNHGIERKIPFLNQHDTNLITKNINHFNIEVTRNGLSEPYVINNGSSAFNILIGDPNLYVKGKQIYTLKYKFINIITNFDVSKYSENPYQELYWNNTGFNQNINLITAKLHFPPDTYQNLKTVSNFSNNADYKNKSNLHPNNKTSRQLASWCYVNENQNRCQISDLSDGIQFQAKHLGRDEDLIFITNFNHNYFHTTENNFIKNLRISNLKADYYLSKDQDGSSQLKVKQSITILFPTQNIEKSFDYRLPFVSSSGHNFTLDPTTNPDIHFDFDGNVDITHKIQGNSFVFNLKSPQNYLHGKHLLSTEYTLKNIVRSEKDGQLLAQTITNFNWDATPENIEINIHLAEDLKSNLKELKKSQEKDEHAKAWCTILSSSKKTVECNMKEATDGYNLSISNIQKNETINFYLGFNNDTFVLPKPNRNYFYYHFAIVTFLLIFIISCIFYFLVYRKNKTIKKYYQNLSTTPNYLPPQNFTVALVGKNYLKKVQNLKLATILELIISKKISFHLDDKKLFRQSNSTITINNLAGLSPEQSDILTILNHGSNNYSAGKNIKIFAQTYSNELERVSYLYDQHLLSLIAQHNLTKARKTHHRSLFSTTILILVSFSLLILCCFSLPIVWNGYKILTNFTPFSIYEGKWLYPFIIISLLVSTIIFPLLYIKNIKLRCYTKQGINLSVYLDGIKSYLKMAEQDRISLIHDKLGNDITNEKIIKLYEDLLPYAALFGLEDYWVKNIQKYLIANKVNYSTTIDIKTLKTIRNIIQRGF